jgi:hypothetical protein
MLRNTGRRIFSMGAAALLGITGTAWAQVPHGECTAPAGNYGLSLRVGGECGTVAMSTAQAFFDKLDSEGPNGLRSVLPLYESTSVAQAVARFNGVTLNLNVPTTGGALEFSIPELDYFRTIDGANRDASLDLLTEELKRGDVLGRIMAYQAQSSPTSPILGVGGLIPQVIATDFDQNFSSFATNIAAPPMVGGQDGSSSNLIGAALSIGSFTATAADGMKSRVKVASLPLSYTLRNAIDPRRQMVFSLPITAVDVNGAMSWALGLGFAYRIPMNDNWTLVPSGRFSGVGSVDLATVSGVYTLGLTSIYIWDLGGSSVAMGNMLSHNSTLKFKSGEYAFDPQVRNTALRNGVLWSQPTVLDGKKMSLEYSLVDTRFVGGTRPYVRNYQELSITLGTNKNAFASRSFIRGGVTVTHGKGTRGLSANIGYWF